MKTCLSRKGSVLILVLIIVSSMALLSVGMAYRTRIEMKLAQANAQRTKVYYLALGGIARTKALLSSQPLSPENIGKMCQFSSTATDEKLFEQIKDTDSSASRWLVYKVRDELGYLNVNSSDPAIWKKIGISKECQAGILDWLGIDSGGNVFSDEQSEFPYAPKNSPCATLKELLFAKGITRDDYLGKGLSQNIYWDSSEEGRNSRTLLENYTDIFNLGMIDIFTVYGKGKININTTSKMMLASLPGLDEQVANLILAYREGTDGQLGTDDDRCLENSAAFADMDGLTKLQTDLLQEYSCYKSDYFRIFSYAEANEGFNCYLMATIICSGSGPQVLYVERLL
jgi:hypothetical protein